MGQDLLTSSPRRCCSPKGAKPTHLPAVAPPPQHWHRHLSEPVPRHFTSISWQETVLVALDLCCLRGLQCLWKDGTTAPRSPHTTVDLQKEGGVAQDRPWHRQMRHCCSLSSSHLFTGIPPLHLELALKCSTDNRISHLHLLRQEIKLVGRGRGGRHHCLFCWQSPLADQ